MSTPQRRRRSPALYARSLSRLRGYVRRRGWFAVRLRPAPRFEVLDALHLVTADGWPASVEELRQKTGLGSTQTVHRHLRRLIDDGDVLQHPRRPKGGFMPARRG